MKHLHGDTVQPSYHITFRSLGFWYVLSSSIIHPHDRLDFLFFPSLYPSFLSNALSDNRFDYLEWNMIDDYDSSEGGWPGLEAFLVGWEARSGTTSGDGHSGRAFGLRLEGLWKVCIQNIEGWLYVE